MFGDGSDPCTQLQPSRPIRVAHDKALRSSGPFPPPARKGPDPTPHHTRKNFDGSGGYLTPITDIIFISESSTIATALTLE